MVGLYRRDRHEGAGGRLAPTDRRQKAEWVIPPGCENGAEPGEIVRAEATDAPRRLGLQTGRVLERLGRFGEARSVSALVAASLGLEREFEPEALAEAARARATPLGTRTDLRALPLVTIDGEDARDFDDAVFAEAGEAGGWRLVVAIADVAHYVRAGSALDRAARARGNSVYFPDRVLPMLPEALSNGWCSLRPDEPRGCLFVEIGIGADGAKRGHRFGRGLMRSAARLTYARIQAMEDAGDAGGLPVAALYGAFRALLAARARRGPLELDLPERQVLLDEAGNVRAVAPRPRLDSHRLIEEFMVLANTCAAEELERLRLPCLYRVHLPPSAEKLEALRGFLRTFGISLPPGDALRPADLDGALRRAAGTEAAPLVNEVMLRSQSQAAYDADNAGHFGLALARYAHFTSPIRRYADLLVHRALIRGLKLGAGGLTDAEIGGFAEAGPHLTDTERRAAQAERDATDRYLAAWLADRVGERFEAKVSGVTRHGLFVALDGSGASGLVPMSSLPDDDWALDEAARTLHGRRRLLHFHPGLPVAVRLREANALTGGLRFVLLPGEGAARPPNNAPPRPAPAGPAKTKGKAKPVKAKATKPGGTKPRGTKPGKAKGKAGRSNAKPVRPGRP